MYLSAKNIVLELTRIVPVLLAHFSGQQYDHSMASSASTTTSQGTIAAPAHLQMSISTGRASSFKICARMIVWQAGSCHCAVHLQFS
eukprot:6175346-Pleurochrysis_carterae.AAC.1